MPLFSQIFPPRLRLLLAAIIALSIVIALNEPFAAQSVPPSNDGERVMYHPSSKVRVVPDLTRDRDFEGNGGNNNVSVEARSS